MLNTRIECKQLKMNVKKRKREIESQHKYQEIEKNNTYLKFKHKIKG